MEKKFLEIGKQVEDMMPELRRESIKFLHDALKSDRFNGVIEFDEDDQMPVYVSYDGGNHPEYASNLYSIVQDVHLNENNEVELCIEEDDEYGIDRCTTMEIYEIATVVNDMIS